jgi:hypothetical protein
MSLKCQVAAGIDPTDRRPFRKTGCGGNRLQGCKRRLGKVDDLCLDRRAAQKRPQIRRRYHACIEEHDAIEVEFPQVFELIELVAVTPIAEAGDFMDVAAELSEQAPPPSVNFRQALHVDGGRVSATMLDERAREMPSFIGEARIMVHDEGKNRPALRRHQARSCGAGSIAVPFLVSKIYLL